MLEDEIEESIREFLLTLSAVTALTTVIRMDELEQEDAKLMLTNTATCAVMITVLEESFFNDISGRCSLADGKIMLSAVAKKKSLCRQLSRAIRWNATTPGTGMVGVAYRGGLRDFDAMLIKGDLDFVRSLDGSDTGLNAVDSLFTVTFSENT